MRGKATKKQAQAEVKRITPAYAGKSTGEYIGALELQDHPRVCGEKIKKLGTGCLISGSPPRMRGKVFTKNIIETCARITPAYAGKSIKLRCPSAR